ncbi:hypothetical protein OG417_08240 [Actinoallomurus sp. NBC_01490]|jgi:hypothetical protein|uniref:hypothetical protein n=1 Tax=Actinoallomurus sp. NBC_01490 TaxID=2903557 RepID=UPI002E2FFC88|nr:hypothetical protein [Actinoallomurus sp. NBC_01490]
MTGERTRVRMSREVRAWLAALLAEDHQMGRVVGEAVTVLFQGGFEPGAPFVIPLESALRDQHPGIALDHSYQRRLRLFQRVRRSVADLATARRRLELRIGAGGLDPDTLAETRRQYEEVVGEEARAALFSRRIQAGLNVFAARKEAVKAGYAAALANRTIDEAFAAFDESYVPGRPVDDVAPARAAADDMLRGAAELEQWLGGDTAPEISELRLETSELRLLFAVVSPDTAVLLVVGIGHDDWDRWYEQALPLARDELELEDGEFTGYDLTTFLTEYFPGEEAEIQAAAHLVRTSG